MRDSPPVRDAPAGLYIHFPFCASHCSYCDFPTVIGRDTQIDAYLDSLETEIDRPCPQRPQIVDTVYFGGGTPSRLEPGQVERILRRVRARFEVLPGSEITLEGNPESLTAMRLRGYREAGVSRVSVGVQSLDDGVLRAAGRAHGADQARDAVARARGCGFAGINVDLIVGLPGERLESWARTVRSVAALGPDHVSVYLLEVDKNTPLTRALRAGRTRVADDDLQTSAYLETVRSLAEHGLSLYEISNFCRPGQRSRHNLKYWTDGDYVGIGLGAHGYWAGRRQSNRRDLDGYLEDLRVGRDPVDWEDPWDPLRRVSEALVMGLRLAEGVDLETLGARYETDLEMRHREAWDRGSEAGLIEIDGSRVFLTPSGRVRSNELFSELI